MSSPLLAYLPILIGVLIALGLALAILLLNSFFGPRRPSTVKGEPFECGNPPVGPARDRFNVKFYLVGLVFLVFDVEVVFMLPWAVQYRTLISDPAIGVLALVEMLIFVAVLLVGLVYVWKRGVLDWNRPGAGEEQL
jgi:NADH-quinone oxidoreductase subunit A